MPIRFCYTYRLVLALLALHVSCMTFPDKAMGENPVIDYALHSDGVYVACRLDRDEFNTLEVHVRTDGVDFTQNGVTQSVSSQYPQAQIFVQGGHYVDNITITGSFTNVFIWVSAGSGNDIVKNQTWNTMQCNADDGHDKVYGGPGSDILLGENDSDELYGGGGDDLLVGGKGADLLFGQGGKDRLVGGLGLATASIYDTTAGYSAIPDFYVDTLVGGGGQDDFFYRSWEWKAFSFSPGVFMLYRYYYAIDTIADLQPNFDSTYSTYMTMAKALVHNN